ncbi:hypothetical protein D3C76_1707680 [compost metagenome]
MDVFEGLSAVFERGHWQRDAAVVEVGCERLLVEVAEVLQAKFFQGNEHVAEGAVEQFNGYGFRCRHQPKWVLMGITHGLARPPCD